MVGIAGLAAVLVATTVALDAPSPAKRPPTPAPADEQLVCRTTAPTGSLIATRKECRTKRQWATMHVDTMHALQGGSCSSAESGHCY